MIISSYGHKSWDGKLPVGKGTIQVVGNEAVLNGRFFLDTEAGKGHLHGREGARPARAVVVRLRRPEVLLR